MIYCTLLLYSVPYNAAEAEQACPLTIVQIVNK